jgi:neopullulanase
MSKTANIGGTAEQFHSSNRRMALRICMVFAVIMGTLSLTAQEIKLDRVEPPSWWIGFKDPHLQLLVHGANIGKSTPSINYPGVKLDRVWAMNNPNYLFLDLTISGDAKPGEVPVSFSVGSKIVTEYLLELKERKAGSANRKSFSTADVIYLIVPDRFANGEPSNDSVRGMLEKPDRGNPDGRHGGDIKGIIDHADYLKDLGITSVWITPLVENDMKKYSYHGYSITDYYKTDPRFGTNEDYVKLSAELHSRGLKLIMDMVFNHCGLNHWWMKDPPTAGWINQWPEFTRTSYRSSTVSDPYRSKYDSTLFLKGWFDNTMPDLDQYDPYLAKYLIQNSIWWVEYAGLDGIRLDTYPYNFKDYMAEWDKAILNEYPNFNIVGECWSAYPDGIAYWQKDARNADGFNSYLPTVFDFAMYDALKIAFTEKDTWNQGILRLYEILSRDFNYKDPSHIVVFADSHDADRFLGTQDQDIRKLKMAMAFILTTRGTPEVCYGTEMLLSTVKDKNGDGYKRKDFPGGWANDSVNGFTRQNLSADQKDMLQYMQKLLNWRKGKEVIHTGKLTQFVPADNLYVYFRYNAKEKVMVVMNNSETETRKFDVNRYKEFLNNVVSAKEVISGKEFKDLSQIEIQPKSALIFEVSK